MSLARVALALSAVFLAFMLGLATAPAPAPTVRPIHTLRLADLRLDAPGPAAALAASRGPAAPPAAMPAAAVPTATVTPAVAAVAPPPPPPPPEAVLRRETTAVTEEGGRLGLVLAGAPGRRLHAGDSFMGWRIASVTRSGAVLVRGRERREAEFFGPVGWDRGSPPGDAPVPRPPAPVSPAPTAADYFRGFKG